MSERIHDDEPDTSEPVVRALLRAERPSLARLPLTYLTNSGTDNAMWRIRIPDGPDVVVRLPRRPGAAAGLLDETRVLERISTSPISAVATIPTVRHVGQPSDRFPHHWSVLEWIDGTDAWTARRELDAGPLDGLASDLASALGALATTDVEGARPRAPGNRGGPLRPLIERLDGWLDDPSWNATALLDVPAVRRLVAEGLEVADEPVTTGFVHGDLIPGNLLVDRGRLTAIIDWGSAAHADTAQDLTPAWAVLPAAERPRFRDAVGVDDAAWIRGRTFALEQAVGGVLYYVPKGHPLGDVMARTLDRILTER